MDMSNSTISSSERLIRNYIRGKDENKPYLLEDVFSSSSYLKISSKFGDVKLPSEAIGNTDIAEILGRSFSSVYENINTYCLTEQRPNENSNIYSCDWLVGMSDRSMSNVYVGCGRYDWQFSYHDRPVVSQLFVTVEQMITFPYSHLDDIMTWLATVPYPWCAPSAATINMPELDALCPVKAYIQR